MDRNSRPNFAALSADEERRRANEEASMGRHAAEDVGGMPERALTRLIFTGVILALIVIGVWIAFAIRTT
jgi:hypothetical protein